VGMFDYIRCEVPLPDGWKPLDALQTKDFNCELVEHLITKDGRLILERIDHQEVVPEEERPYPNEKGILGIVGSIKTTTSRHESDFHGVIHFYGFEDGDPHKWHEYEAKFTDGKLVHIITGDR
jgi:hypothetical protein